MDICTRMLSPPKAGHKHKHKTLIKMNAQNSKQLTFESTYFGAM